MAVDIGPKDASPKRPVHFTLRRRQCAQYSRSTNRHRNSEAEVQAAACIVCGGGGRTETLPGGLARQPQHCGGIGKNARLAAGQI
jgi:hypothetical protein